MRWDRHPELRYFIPEIAAAATEHDLDPELLGAVILTESAGLAHAYRFEPQFWARYKLATKEGYKDGNPRRLSASYGLMQVMYPTARELGFTGFPEALFVPDTNLQYGGACLKRCLVWARQWQASDRDTLLSALAAYNGGRSSAQKPPNPRNVAYALRVLDRLSTLAHDL